MARLRKNVNMHRRNDGLVHIKHGNKPDIISCVGLDRRAGDKLNKIRRFWYATNDDDTEIGQLDQAQEMEAGKQL